MSQIQNMTPPNLRLGYETSNAYVGPEPIHKTFLQKLGQGLLKVGSFALRPAGAVLGILGGPIGLPLAFGCFGAAQLTDNKLAQIQAKDQIELNSQPKPTGVQFPGLFETAAMPAGQQVTEFIAPTHTLPTINEVVINREAARQEMTQLPNSN